MDYNEGHATSQPVAEDVVIRDTVIYEDPPFTSAEPTLNEDEIAHFKERGFLVKRALLPEPDVFEAVLDYMWANVPRGVLDRDDPESWVDAPEAKWRDEDAERVGLLARGNWKMRSRGAAGIGTEPFLVERIANHPNMLAVARAFIGEPVQAVRRVRGIYAILPKPPGAAGRYGPHADYMAAHLTAMVMVDSIPPRAGGFTVWPGSHLRLHPHWDTVHGGVISDDRREGYRVARDAVLRDIAPVELPGEAGDVVFWHPRLLHSAGINDSANWPRPVVRVIVPCDYQPQARTYFDDLEYGPGPDYQFWIDTRNFSEDVPPTADNLWRDWAI